MLKALTTCRPFVQSRLRHDITRIRNKKPPPPKRRAPEIEGRRPPNLKKFRGGGFLFVHQQHGGPWPGRRQILKGSGGGASYYCTFAMVHFEAKHKDFKAFWRFPGSQLASPAGLRDVFVQVNLKNDFQPEKKHSAEVPLSPRRQRNPQQTMILLPCSEFELILAGRPRCFFQVNLKKRFHMF